MKYTLFILTLCTLFTGCLTTPHYNSVDTKNRDYTTRVNDMRECNFMAHSDMDYYTECMTKKGYKVTVEND